MLVMTMKDETYVTGSIGQPSIVSGEEVKTRASKRESSDCQVEGYLTKLQPQSLRALSKHSQFMVHGRDLRAARPCFFLSCFNSRSKDQPSNIL